MSRKDYVAIAEAIKALRSDIAWHLDEPDRVVFTDKVDTHAQVMCDIFAADNSAFDRKRFLAACGVTA